MIVRKGRGCIVAAVVETVVEAGLELGVRAEEGDEVGLERC
jgi:hypothetical protein